MARVRLKAEHRELLSQLYRSNRRTVDDLPYTEEFEQLYTQFIARSGLIMTRHDVWRALASLRKARRLVRKQR